MNSTAKALKKYQELICNFQKRNRELLYKVNPNSIGFSKLELPKDFPEPVKVRSMFRPGRLGNDSFISTLDKGIINLDDHFCLKYENASLRRRINAIRLADDNYQKEFGISGAWFVGPFLLWKTKAMAGSGGPDNIFISPILKNPIDIRKNKSKNDVIEFEEAEVHHVNPTLKILLKKEYGIDLLKEYIGDIKEVLAQIIQKINEAKIETIWNVPDIDVLRLPPKTKTIEDENGQKIRISIPLEDSISSSDLEILKKISTNKFIIQDVFYVDVFDASKMSLYYDYEEIINNLGTEDYGLIKDLVDENSYADSIPSLKKECEKENYYVVDIDQSQHKAIKESNVNKGFVVQGPPGTGKSQTITNLISQLLADGKKVLFVAEKRAALDVVYSRLSSSGLDRHSVILHDNEVNKSALYKSYVQSFQDEVDHKIAHRWNEISESLNLQSRNVSLYFDELSSTPFYTGMTNYDFLSEMAIVEKYDLSHACYKYVSTINLPDFIRSKDLIDNTEMMYRSFGRFENTFWKNFRKSTFVNEVLLKEMEGLSVDFKRNFQINDSSVRILNEKFPNSDYRNINEGMLDGLDITDYDAAVFMVNDFLGTSNSKVHLLELQDKVNNLKSTLSSFRLIKPTATLEQINNLQEYFKTPKSFFKFFSLKYWNMRKIGQSLLEDKTQVENANIYQDWLQFTKFENEVTSKIELVYRSIQLMVTDKGKQIDEVGNYIKFTNAILKMKSMVGGDRFNIQFDNNYLRTLVEDFKECIKFSASYISSKKALDLIKLNVDEWFESEINENVLSYGNILESLIVTKDDLVVVQNLKKNFAAVESVIGLNNFDKFVHDSIPGNNSWYSHLKYHLMLVLKDKIYTEYPNIRIFSSTQTDAELKKLNTLFDLHKSVSQKAVDYFVSNERMKTVVPNKILKMIENEANKTRRIKSPREVMESGALEVMLEWKRCWLMSPLSISQILPNTSQLFDVVIFDEASQVKIEDAIPSIYRAKTLIVVGDNKQMPPTNFFGSSHDEDDDEEFEIPESLLDQAAKKYPSLMLEWHYRSESESLIAFSNFAYYEGRLVVPPNPGTLCSSKAIDFVRVDNGTFDSKNGNEFEAREIVNFVRKILVDDPKSSLGVISMGMSQQRAINKLIEELCETDEEFAKAYAFSLAYFEDGSYKGFFNRNLENVQGDERDTILLSVGYGRNKDGKFRKAFGPLSMDGGGRRLNVAITRARKKMRIFCSFDPIELPSDNEAFSRNPNTTTFARFLEYAKAISDHDEKKALQILELFSTSKKMMMEKNTFRSIVASELMKRGYDVRENVGSCGFTIDLGIFGESTKSEFSLGIDINKGMKGKPSFLRDSFRNREVLLKKRGWRIFTLWMQDWVDDKEKVLKEIESLLGNEIARKVS